MVIPRDKKGFFSWREFIPDMTIFDTPFPISITRNGKEKRFSVTNVLEVANSDEMVRSEQPGVNGISNARNLAKLAAFMANKGELEGQRLMSRETWEAMHAKEKLNSDTEIGGIRTLITQGGVNHFVSMEDDQEVEKWFKHGHIGFYGWKGFGGSVIQWNPDLDIGFAYVPGTVVWYNPNSAGNIQAEVTKCCNRLMNS